MSVVVVGAALVVGGVILNASLHAGAVSSVKGAAPTQAHWIEDLAGSAALPGHLPPVPAPRLTLVQVLDANGRPIASSPQLEGVSYRVGKDTVNGKRIDPDHDGDPGPRGGPWYLESAPAVIDGRPATVVTFTSLADYERAVDTTAGALLIAFPILLVLVGVATWWLVGRALRPVERMRREVDAVTATSLESRVDEPPFVDEVSKLARTLNSMLERLQRARDRQRRFVSDASHELRTPVANMSAALDVAQRYPDQTDWSAVAADLANQSGRMARMVDDLLLLAQAEHGDAARPRVPVPLGELVRQEIDHLPSNHSTVVLVEPVPSEAVVEGDRHQLERILANLLENAARHASSRVEVGIHTDGAEVMLNVTDDGPGIPIGDRERIFEPFVRLDSHRARPGGGAGLGLAIVRDLLEDEGGRIMVADGPAGGAVFEVTLPRVR
jgi:signal transduction histidine kinase